MKIKEPISEENFRSLPLTYTYLKPLNGKNFVSINRYTYVKKYQTYKYPIVPFNKKISKIV